LISNKNSNILKLVLNDGYYYEDIVPKKFEKRKNLPFAKSWFKKYIININLSKLNNSGEADYKISNTNTMLNLSELKYTIDSLNKSYKKDLISFTENIYQRSGVSSYNVNQPQIKTSLIKMIYYQITIKRTTRDLKNC